MTILDLFVNTYALKDVQISQLGFRDECAKSILLAA